MLRNSDTDINDEDQMTFRNRATGTEGYACQHFGNKIGSLSCCGSPALHHCGVGSGTNVCTVNQVKGSRITSCQNCTEYKKDLNRIMVDQGGWSAQNVRPGFTLITDAASKDALRSQIAAVGHILNRSNGSVLTTQPLDGTLIINGQHRLAQMSEDSLSLLGEVVLIMSCGSAPLPGAIDQMLRDFKDDTYVFPRTVDPLNDEVHEPYKVAFTEIPVSNTCLVKADLLDTRLLGDCMHSPGFMASLAMLKGHKIHTSDALVLENKKEICDCARVNLRLAGHPVDIDLSDLTWMEKVKSVLNDDLEREKHATMQSDT